MMRRTVTIGVVVAMSAVLRPSGQAPPPGAGRVPWRVAEATVEPLASPTAAGNTVLRVRFERGVETPRRIPFDAGGVMVTLADDGTGPDATAGDGLYTAIGSMDLVAFRRDVERLARSRTAEPAKVFATRAFVPTDARLDPGLLGPGRQFPWTPWGDPVNVDAERSLLIRDPSVVQDPTRTRASCGQASMGPWSFGHLMEQLANTPVTGVTGAELAEAWLSTWQNDQVVNTFTAHARPLIEPRILGPWKAASGGPNAPLDLSIAPFRLQAIVNRIDLRKQTAYGGGSAGELRFVFNVVSPQCQRRNFQVIFEFGVQASGCVNLKALAQQWKQLDQLPLGSAQYNAALEAITQAIVSAGVSPRKPNGSALNQLRTNENHVDPAGGLDWEAREFRLDAQTHLLEQVTVAQTPQRTFNNTDTLGDYVEWNAPAIKAQTNVVPLAIQFQVPFRGASRVYGISNFWDGPATGAYFIDDREARHAFSLQTCNGCHRTETDTSFQHVVPADFGEPIQLSGFMTGIMVPDVADGTPTRVFDELHRRALDLDALLATQCLVVVLDEPLKTVH